MEREQFVVVERSHSPTLKVLSGAPQGSVLGPLLCVMTIASVVEVRSIFLLMTLCFTELLPILIIIQHSSWMLTLLTLVYLQNTLL